MGKLEKKIEDIVVFSNEFEICWYIKTPSDETDSYNIEGLGIGIPIKDLGEGVLYSKKKIFVADYENGKIKEVFAKSNTFLCTDGY